MTLYGVDYTLHSVIKCNFSINREYLVVESCLHNLGEEWCKGKVRAHAVAARSCRRLSPVALAFELVVEMNLLPRDTGPL